MLGVPGTLYTHVMPKKYSAEALAKRRDRAIRFGFLKPGAYVAVPRAIKERVKDIAESLATHSEHNLLNKQPSHFARVATCHAARDGLITKAHADKAQYSHRRANAAKHDWTKQDPLQLTDPWAGYRNSEKMMTTARHVVAHEPQQHHGGGAWSDRHASSGSPLPRKCRALQLHGAHLGSGEDTVARRLRTLHRP